MQSLNENRAFLSACFWSRHLIRTAFELLQSLALHLQFHRALADDSFPVTFGTLPEGDLRRHPSFRL
jgi:hypothetical protein